MKLLIGLTAVVGFLLSGVASAQQKNTAQAGYVDLTPVRLSLAMPKDRTIALLSEQYEVTPWKGDAEDSWAIAEKTGQHVVIGLVCFANSALIRAARFWDVESDSAYSLAHTISLLLDQLRNEGFTNCTISTRKAPTPSVETEVLGFDCGQKGIVVQADVYRGKDARAVLVMENLQAKSGH
ncbi:MAG: hypothetical protein DMG93_12080 [Acidobacteria bacterium]|nr:MAG: hypothetical protein DMG93_12080 [Acidobacteriota bacterium]